MEIVSKNTQPFEFWMFNHIIYFNNNRNYFGFILTSLSLFNFVFHFNKNKINDIFIIYMYYLVYCVKG